MTHCPCDCKVIFPTSDIAAGLSDLPRQIGGFPQFRRAMLAELRRQSPLSAWNARDEEDLGVMLLEMWAYVCDVLSFYDEVIANELYLRSARLRPSLRKLTGMLGYIPRPAVSSSVLLTALAEGRKALTLEAGTAFRSEAFDDEAPQVFELNVPTGIHPLNNRWKLDPQRSKSLDGGTYPYVLLKEENKKVQKNEVVFIRNNNSNSVHTVGRRSEITGDDEEHYIQLEIAPELILESSTDLEEISISTPAQSAGLWTMGSTPTAILSGETQVILDGLYRQLKAGQHILVSKGETYRWFKLSRVSDTMMNINAGGEFDVTDADDNTVTLSIPAAQAPATKLTLDQDLNDASRTGDDTETWNNSDRADLIVHYGFVDVGALTSQRDSAIDGNSDLVLAPASGRKLATPVDSGTPSSFVLQDVNEISVKGNGSVDYDTGALDFQGTDWNDALTPPVKVFGNVLQASRGETVKNEILGSGDAAKSNQTFTLKKSPLTYIAAPTSGDERGISTTLTVWVDGVQWQEVASFYGRGAEEEIYIVRQNDDHETLIIFGDGKRGRRLPSGSSNVIADYRYGAGAALPPANSITQLTKPVKGVSGVNNPFAASGGSDAEEADGIRRYAPQSALLLGRAVSMQDFIVATAGMSGVMAVHGEWRWNNRRQRPVVQLWYIGDSDSAAITAALRNLADPAIALDVDKADHEDLVLAFDVKVDDAYHPSEVCNSIRALLTDEESGLLSPRNIGIGQPLFRSRLFAAILDVPGTLAVTHATCNDLPFDDIAIKPDPGKYFDVESGALIINGKEDYDG